MSKRGIRELRVGAVISIALAILIGFVFFLGGDQSIFGDTVRYKIYFNSTAGLYKGDPVLLTGVEVGNVVNIGFPENIDLKKILVEIEVDKAIQDRIRQDTRAKVASASLVYGKVIQLSMGSSEMPLLEENAFIPVDESPGYGAIVDSTGMVLHDIRKVLGKLDRGEGALGAMLNDPMKIEQTLFHLSKSTEHLSNLLERADRGEGPLGVMFSDSVDLVSTLDHLRIATGDLQSITTNLKNNQSALGKLMNDEKYGKELTYDLHRAVKSLANIATKIDTGRGTVGQLINDPGLYYGMQHVVLGVERSSLTKWLIQKNRKAGAEGEKIIQKEINK